MRAVFAYTWWRSARTRQWIVPALLYLLVLVVLNPPGGTLRSRGAIGVILLLGASSWITATVFNSEGASQAAVTQASVGGAVRSRLGGASAALAAALVLALASSSLALLLRGDSGTVPEIGLNFLIVLAAHAAAALLGGGIGAAFAQPVFTTPAVAFWLALLACVACLAVPISPLPIVVGQLSSGTDPSAALAGFGVLGLVVWFAGVLGSSRAEWRR